MNIRNTILGLLMYGPQTGYELKQAFDSSLGFFAGASFGSIYPILRKCGQEGLVRMEQEIQDGRPNRKIYSLTEKGRSEFLRSAAESLVMSPHRNEFLVRLFFFGFLDAGRRREVIDEYLEHIRGKQRALDALGTVVEEQADPFQAACYRFGLRYLTDLAENVRVLGDELAAALAEGDCCCVPPVGHNVGRHETKTEEGAA